jgi:hypothetical protein
MITNEGKQLVAKFLLSQAPNYATHIAAGVGATPLGTEETDDTPPTKKSLDFEAFRVPISSKGFIKEDGVEKVVFKAEMPTEQRYQITELGVYPSERNSIAGNYDGKLLIAFSPTEQWQEVFDGSASAVPYRNEAIDDDNANSNINQDIESALFINSDATAFNFLSRRQRYEFPRFLNRSLMVSGSSSYLDEFLNVEEGSRSVENANISFDLSGNLPTDEIKLALSLVSKESTNNTNPDKVRIRIELINNLPGLDIVAPKAVTKIVLNASDFVKNGDVNRYVVVTKLLSQFVKDPFFSWSNVNYVKIYTSIIVDNEVSGEYFVVYDGMRLENVTADNPLYTLFAYSVIKTQDFFPILKKENSSNYVEYRFAIGVDS